MRRKVLHFSTCIKKKGIVFFLLRYKLGIVFVYVIIKTNVFLKKKKNFREFTVRKA